MHKSIMLTRIGIAVVAVLWLGSASLALADSWLELDASGTAVLKDAAAARAPTLAVDVFDATGLSGLQVAAQTAGVTLRQHENKVGQFVEVGWPDASIYGEVGTPGLPVIRRLVVIPAGASVSLAVEAGSAVTVGLAKLEMPGWVWSVQPPVEKVPGARENAVFAFDEQAYATDAEVPAERVVFEELGVVRGQRVGLLEIRPVSHNPVAGTLTFWPEILVGIQFSGGYLAQPAISPLPGLNRVVLNPELLPEVKERGSGDYLIVVASAYQSAIASFASAKQAQGYTVMTWVPTSASNTVIKNYIQSLWNSGTTLDYVLLVGDTDTIPHWTGGGEGTPPTDLPYVCMNGTSDWYPDIAIGRFPVASPDHVQAMVNKTLYYENGPLADPAYLKRAVFMASNDNYTVSEGTHNWVISNYMDPNGYTSDKLYCHTYSATTQQVRNSFNNGRFFGIYSGHGDDTYWADGPPFYQSDVTGLTNVNMYSFVCSFACLTGNFPVSECFMETWVRVANKGAATALGSSVTSYWTEDDVLEKRLFDVIFDTNDNVVGEVGPVLNETKMRYLAEMGSGSTTRRYFEMYNLMGDPSLWLLSPPTPPQGIQVTPSGGLVSSGPPGGPFTPGSIDYTVKNVGTTPLNYTVAKTQPWVSLTNPSGALPGGASVIVQVSINSLANAAGSGTYLDTVAFTNTTDHMGDTARSVMLKVGVPSVQYSWNMDANPGWTVEGLWAWGQPTGQGGQYGYPDPTSGYTGTKVYGYNLSGDYENNLAERNLTSAALNCSGMSEVSLRFWRRLGVDLPTRDHAYVRVSTNGTSWTTLWENTAAVTDTAWVYQQLDLSSLATNQPTVYLRWTMGTTNSTRQYCGWNLDDIEVWGLPPGGSIYPRGDLNCDGVVNFGDINPFVLALTDPVAYATAFPYCNVNLADINGDGAVNFGDINPFVALLSPPP